jgi:hypothetical protein
MEISPAERAALLQAPTLTLKETANVLGIGLSALRDGLRRGDLDIQQVRVGTRVVIPTAAVLRFLGMEDSFRAMNFPFTPAEGICSTA